MKRPKKIKFYATIEVYVPNLSEASHTDIVSSSALRSAIETEFGWVQSSGIRLLKLTPLHKGELSKFDQPDA